MTFGDTVADILLAAKPYVNLMDIYQTCQENPQKKLPDLFSATSTRNFAVKTNGSGNDKNIKTKIKDIRPYSVLTFQATAVHH